MAVKAHKRADCARQTSTRTPQSQTEAKLFANHFEIRIGDWRVTCAGMTVVGEEASEWSFCLREAAGTGSPLTANIRAGSRHSVARIGSLFSGACTDSSAELIGRGRFFAFWCVRSMMSASSIKVQRSLSLLLNDGSGKPYWWWWWGGDDSERREKRGGGGEESGVAVARSGGSAVAGRSQSPRQHARVACACGSLGLSLLPQVRASHFQNKTNPCLTPTCDPVGVRH